MFQAMHFEAHTLEDDFRAGSHGDLLQQRCHGVGVEGGRRQQCVKLDRE